MARPRSETLTGRETQVMEAVWGLGNATAEQVREALPEPLHDSSVRTLLRILESKGYLRHEAHGKAYVYSARVGRAKAQGRALRDVLARFFGGSAHDLVLRLLEEDHLTPEQLDELRRATREAGQAAQGGRTMNGILDPAGGWAPAALAFGLDVAAKATALILLGWLVHAALGRRRALRARPCGTPVCSACSVYPWPAWSSPGFQSGSSPRPGPRPRRARYRPAVPTVPAGLSPEEMVEKSPDGLSEERTAEISRRGSPAPTSPLQQLQSQAVAVTATTGGGSPSARGVRNAAVGSWSLARAAGLLVGVYAGVVGLLALTARWFARGGPEAPQPMWSGP